MPKDAHDIRARKTNLNRQSKHPVYLEVHRRAKSVDFSTSPPSLLPAYS